LKCSRKQFGKVQRAVNQLFFLFPKSNLLNL
jgi:hypothetical protein